MRSLLKYAINYYSQAGEDGILEEIFKRLKIDKNFYVDVGSHNGTFMSNTQYLREKNWDGLCLEYSMNHFSELQKVCKKYNTNEQKTYCERIKITETNLEEILDRYEVSKEFCYLDIDIDSYNYYVWKNLKKYRPKVVQMEIRESIPLGVEQINDKDHWLTSFTSMLKMGIEKNYTLVAYTGLNMIFVRNDLNYIVPKEERENPNVELYFHNKKLREYRQLVNEKSEIQKQLERTLYA